MKRSELLQVLRDVCAEILEKDCSQVEEKQELTEIGLDSIGSLDLVTAIEKRLEILIPDGFLIGVRSVGRLLDVVERCDQNQDYWTPERRALL